ncbi:YDG domain-containing protein [Mycena kentingensis (nom. inval.)]|nr:YDG domain-containing protein [Mycena kentingensis (nom. inval.)]
MTRRDPRVHDDIPGVPVGTLFADRKDAYDSGVHGEMQAGIFGTARDGGAFSIVINGAYEDDQDKGDTIIFTGEGTGSVDPTKSPVPGVKTAQVGDQDPKRTANLALQRSKATKNPVRVIRGPEGNAQFCPAQGYRYDGLYEVTNYEFKPGAAGFKMCFFTLERCTDFTQVPLPTHIRGDGPNDRFWSIDRSCPEGELLNQRIRRSPAPPSPNPDAAPVSIAERARQIAGTQKNKYAGMSFRKKTT